MGPTSRGYKHTAQTKPEEQGPLKLTTPLAPQVSYSQTKMPQLVSQDRPIPILWLRGCPRLSLYELVLMESDQPSTKHRASPLNHVSIKHILTRREPLKHTAQRATLKIKLHIPLIKFN
jgi:hypothetical protein